MLKIKSVCLLNLIKMDLVVRQIKERKLYFTEDLLTELTSSEGISWKCTKRGCKAKLRTDKDIQIVISGKLDHTHEVDERKLELSKYDCR